MKTKFKPFVCVCEKCGQEFQSLSRKGMLACIRRHAKNHPKKDFPLRYFHIIVNGKFTSYIAVPITEYEE